MKHSQLLFYVSALTFCSLILVVANAESSEPTSSGSRGNGVERRVVDQVRRLDVEQSPSQTDQTDDEGEEDNCE